MKNLLILIITSLLLSSCASPYIGQRMYPDNWFPTYELGRSQTGHKIATLEHINLEFDYKIEEENIHFDGEIRCNEGESAPGLARVEFDMLILFTDAKGIVVAHESYSPLVDDTFCGKSGSPKPFKATYPYNGYRGVKFGYRVMQYGY